MRIRLALIAIAIIWTGHTSVRAESFSPCRDRHGTFENLHFQSIDIGPKCLLLVHVDNTNDLKYRSYIFSSDESLTVFMSFGEGNPSTMTGAEVFHFPSANSIADKQSFTWEIESSKSTLRIIFGSSGMQFDINTKSAELDSVTGGTVSTNPKILPQFKSGVSLKLQNSDLITSPFSFGRSPVQDPKSLSCIQFPATPSPCCVSNSMLFDYTASENSILKRPWAQTSDAAKRECK